MFVALLWALAIVTAAMIIVSVIEGLLLYRADVENEKMCEEALIMHREQEIGDVSQFNS